MDSLFLNLKYVNYLGNFTRTRRQCGVLGGKKQTRVPQFKGTVPMTIKHKEKELRRQLSLVSTEESAIPGKSVQEIRDYNNQLWVINCETYRGNIVRARSHRLWMGEAPSRRVLSDEQMYTLRNEIKLIRYGNTTTRDKKTIERGSPNI